MRIQNNARTKIPNEPKIWITAAQLEEAHGNVTAVDKIMKKACKVVREGNIKIDREYWIGAAIDSEKGGMPNTACAIVRETSLLTLEAATKSSRRAVWSKEAKTCASNGAPRSASAIYEHMLSFFPKRRRIWVAATQHTRRVADSAAVVSLLLRAVQHLPKDTILWLMAAKEAWVGVGDISQARKILEDAFASNSGSSDVWLAAAKLEWENGSFARARTLLQHLESRRPPRECG